MIKGDDYMLVALKGYYDGKQIIVDENERIITILEKLKNQKVDARAEKRKRLIESDAFVIPSGRTVEEIDKYIREMRDDDRI